MALALLAAAATAGAQTITNVTIDDGSTLPPGANQGDWRTRYGSCYSLIPQPPGTLFEFQLPTSFQSSQFAANTCGGGPLAGSINWRVALTPDGNGLPGPEAPAFQWSYCEPGTGCTFGYHDIYRVGGVYPGIPGQGEVSQFNACLNTFKNGVWDNDLDKDDPLIHELRLAPGSAGNVNRIAYYFIGGQGECRAQGWRISIRDLTNNIPLVSEVYTDRGIAITDLRLGKYLVFDVANLPNNVELLIRFEAFSISSIGACGPLAGAPSPLSDTDGKWNSVIAGVFLSGPNNCAAPNPGVDIIKFTNGADANDPNGAGVPNIPSGGLVTWTYRVTNTGTTSVPQADVVVTDNTTGVIPTFTSVLTGDADSIFEPGEVWLYTATGTALNLTLPAPGVTTVPNSCTASGTQPPRTAYTNIGTVTIPGATDTDPSSYCNPPDPRVTIIKFTNGADANDPNAAGVPNISPGGVVTWTYRVTNTGSTSVPQAQVVVTDSTTGVTPTFTSVLVGNGDTIFEPGEQWLYTATGTALNLTLPAPGGVTTVPNSCTAGGTQPPRTAYTNIGTVTIPGATAEDPSSYCNQPPPPSVAIIKFTNGADANDPNAAGVPNIAVGGVVTWTYHVTNTGSTSVPQAQVVVTDSTTGVTPTFTSVVTGDADAIFEPGEVWLYTATGTALNLVLPAPGGVTTVPNSCTAGGTQPPRTAYTNIGTVTIPGGTASDPSSYCNPPRPSVTIIKFTNGLDADDPNAAVALVPRVVPGAMVTWTYRVTNTGNTNVPRAQVLVTDNTTGVTPTFTSVITGNADTIFEPGEVWLYTAVGTALNLTLPPPGGVTTTANSCTGGGVEPPRTAYVNLGTVTIPGATANNPSSYCNPPPPPPACSVDVTKQCSVVPPPVVPGNYTCTKPIDTLSMIWNGPQTQVHIKAWKGAIGSTLLYDSATAGNPIAIGEQITVTGIAGSPNDLVWEIFNVVTANVAGSKIGNSTFHVSCSDRDMDSADDCGKIAGDGKALSGFLNQWTFDGMSGGGQTLTCSQTSTPPVFTDACEVPTGGGQVKYRYVVTNNSAAPMSFSLVDKVGAATVYSNTGTLAAGGSQTFEDFIATITSATTNTVTVTGTVGTPPNQTSCEASDSVTATVKPCALTTATPTPVTNGKQLRWSITNAGPIDITLANVIAVWPSANGFLSKVKLDGDVASDDDISCSGGTCFANVTNFVADAKKTTIKAGATRLFALEFQNNANTDLSQYVLVINFGSGCSLSFNGEPQVCGTSGSIGDTVWFDTNNNGIQDFPAEPRASNVLLTLTALNGTVLGTTTTDANGNYLFNASNVNTNICAGGRYFVTMTPPAGFNPAQTNGPGSTAANDSNVNPSLVVLPANATDLTVDFGLISGINYCPAQPVAGASTVGTLFADLLAANTPAPAGTPFAGQMFPVNTVIVRYDQSFAVNDNTYGTGSDWGHKFNDLVGSDMAQFAIFNAGGTKTLEFKIDYISASTGAPSGYASLGVTGGEGKLLSGNGAWVLKATTSLDDNLNNFGYCPDGVNGRCKTGAAPQNAALFLNSGPTANTTFATTPNFSLINSYYAVLDAAAFGAGGLTNARTQVVLVSQHNSPAKVSSFTPTPCP